jgi:alpha-L-rhamnosidase
MSKESALPPLPRRIWWPWDEPASCVAFYRAFTVHQAARATLYLSASGPCAVWLDDRRLPVPDSPLPPWRVMRRCHVDLTPGVRALHILVASGGHGQPFVLACLDWEENGVPVRVGTDANWNAVVQPPLEWMPPTPPGESLPAELVPAGEAVVDSEPELDLLDEINAWRSAFPPGIDIRVQDEPPADAPECDGVPARGYTSGSLLQDNRASAFEYTAWASDGVWAEPWGMPCNAPDDFCRLSTGWQEISSGCLTQVIAMHQGLTAAGTGVWAYADGTLRMRPVAPFPSAPPRLENIRPGNMWHQVREAHSQTVNSWLDQYEARAPHAVLDVGSETFARVRVQLRSGGPAILALTTGESVPEIHRYDRRITDVFELENGETFVTSPTGFRYVKLMALSARGGTVTLEPVQVQHIRYSAERVGRFACSDPLLNRIWTASADTLHLCMQNEVWDATKRDQLPWMANVVTEALAAYHVFGNVPLIRRSLAILSELGPAPARPLAKQLYPGLQAAWKTERGELNGIPSYTMWWVVGLADYVRYSGDRSLVQEYATELIATLQHMIRCVGPDGLWHFPRGRNHVGWALLPAREYEMCCHLLACLAMGLGTDLLASLGRLNAAEYCSALHMRMREAARRAWIDPQLSGSADAGGSTGEDGSPGWSHHVYAMAIRSGCMSPQEAAVLFRYGLETDPVFPMTFWHRFAELEAAAFVGQVQWGLDYLRRHWGSALEAGMTTLWEAFDPAWLGDDPHGVSIVTGESATHGGYRTSHCHGSSSGPAAWLHAAVLGVTPDKAGFAAIAFNPALGDLEWAEGAIPTPHGPIHVSLRRREGGRPKAELIVPDGVEVRIREDTRQAWAIEVAPYASSGCANDVADAAKVAPDASSGYAAGERKDG